MVFERIRKARPSRLYLVSDGPRGEEDRALVDACRAIVQNVDWPCEVTRYYSEKNLGLKNRVVSGLDEVFLIEESAIVLEDDCLPSSSFFSTPKSCFLAIGEMKRLASSVVTASIRSERRRQVTIFPMTL